MTDRPDRQRAGRLMEAAEIDALVVTAPEAVRYLTGVSAGVAALFRRAGAAIVLLPADPGVPVSAIVTDLAADAMRAAVPDTRDHPMWVERATAPAGATSLSDLRFAGIERPETFDATVGFGLLGDALAERGLEGGRVGLDLDFWPARDLETFRSILPDLGVTDGSGVLDLLRAVKTTGERAALAAAGRLAEAGVRAALPALVPGATRDDIAAAWSIGVDAAARDQGVRPEDRWEYISFGPEPWGRPDRLQRGDIVKFDVGTVVDGYSSDSARSFCVGPPSSLAQALYDALAAGFQAGCDTLAPGVPLSLVHQATTKAIRKSGLPQYARGHFGHAVGLGVFGEMAPFISATSSAVAEVGMVLAFETPLYVDGVGGLIIEDQMTVTQTGSDPLWSLGHDLVPV